jgi:hypothetical protein
MHPTPWPEPDAFLYRPVFKWKTLMALISLIALFAHIDSLVVRFASSRLRGECRFDLFQGTGVSDGDQPLNW